MALFIYLSLICSAAYGSLLTFIAVQARRRENLLLAGCCGVTCGWAASNVVWPSASMIGGHGLVDVIRIVSWYTFLMHLYSKAGIAPRWQIRGFRAVSIGVFGLSIVSLLADSSANYTLTSLPIVLRLTLLVFELLLIENLYLNLPETSRWHVALPCVLLGAIACLDILVTADAALYHRVSEPLACVRMVVMLVIAPLLVLAAFREQRWRQPVRLSRTAAFHSATLVLSGSVLLALALAGELLRRLDDEIGWIAEVSLVSSGLIGFLVFVSSKSARSIVQRIVTRHFFADRYDYRHQWLQCIATLSGTDSNERVTLYTRAIRAVADVVNSPNGALFLYENASGTLSWASSWNLPEAITLPSGNPIVEKLITNQIALQLDHDDLRSSVRTLNPDIGHLWLGIPLLHINLTIGVVIVGRPRVPFHLDQEVFDLLHILGREVGTYIAEQHATETMMQTRDLLDYGKRFAFVAHDIKNVSSQLGLLLQNAERHLSNPEFQSDMVSTVRASVGKIDGLLRRLDRGLDREPEFAIAPVEHLNSLVALYRHDRNMRIDFDFPDDCPSVAISPEAFNASVTHIVNNALEACSSRPIEIAVRHDVKSVLIDVTDHGGGMSAAFIRDELFTPFRTSKADGSGIGAFQARELIREAGGQLVVMSEEGVGTTMRILLRRAETGRSALALSSLAGGWCG